MEVDSQTRKLIRYLHAAKVASYKQIQREIYPDLAYKTVAKRLAALQHRGLLIGQQDRITRIKGKTISITKKAYQAAINHGDEDRLELRSDAIVHDLTLNDLRFDLMNLERIDAIKTENQLQTWGKTEYPDITPQIIDVNADAAVRIKSANGKTWVALELELHPKSIPRYRELIHRYYSFEDIPLVLFICANQQLRNKIESIEKQLYPSSHPKFFYASLPFPTNTESVCLSNFNNDKLFLN